MAEATVPNKRFRSHSDGSCSSAVSKVSSFSVTDSPKLLTTVRSTLNSLSITPPPSSLTPSCASEDSDTYYPQNVKKPKARRKSSGHATRFRRGMADISFKFRVVAAQLPDLILPAERKILNVSDQSDDTTSERGHLEDPESCQDVVKELTRYMLRLKSMFMSEDGKHVDYDGLRESVVFTNYKVMATKLQRVDFSELSDVERKAVFLNLYNVLTLHGVAKKSKVPRSPLEIRGFWRRTCYNIGGQVYSLDDIEHGILRGNQPHHGREPFSSDDDPRCRCIVPLDPRIHFALVCGAQSCPGIGVYTVDNVERSLEGAARMYVENELIIGPRAITLPKIFLWFGQDFGEGEAGIIEWCTKYMSSEQLKALDELAVANKGCVDIHFADYNWMLNVSDGEDSRD